MLDLEAWGKLAAKSGINAPFWGETDGGGRPAAFLQLHQSRCRWAPFVSPPTGHHDHPGQGPGHPQTLRPRDGG